MVDMPASGGSYIRDPATGALSIAPAETEPNLAPVNSPPPAATVTTDAPVSPVAPAKSGA